jgi:hypothetical protein
MVMGEEPVGELVSRGPEGASEVTATCRGETIQDTER